MRTTAELRAGFRAFFESKGHEFRPSAPLIPRADDRSTLLVSAGMQPLMPFFLGLEEPPAPLLTTVQKVFRTPDIDEVGLDTFHLTFFEMLGNFSFGQYFKEGAIDFAWEFIFEHMKLDPDRIWCSVFAGDPELGLGEDEVAIAHWERKGMPPERITRLPRADNFWSVGGPGPCGPDSEIFFDWGEDVGCRRPECAPGCECERFLEFWNLVFMEFELHADGSLTPLPNQNIDTGLGLERGARILQQVPSVFDTDGYQEIMHWIADRSGVGYGESEQATKAHRILADHGRGMTFLAADGVAPSNEGRGYVMRRIVRRAVQQAGRIGLDPPFLGGLGEVVIEQAGDAYPELREHADEIRSVLAAEEERFAETLARGLKLFEEVAGGNMKAIAGQDAFRLHDTYGFPLELTEELARERGLPVDVDGFNRLMEEQRLRSRRAVEEVDVRVAGDVQSRFVGYEKTDVLTAILAYEQLGDTRFQAKLEQSPFYPEGGGQVSDSGYIENEETGARAELVAAHRLPRDDQVLEFEGEGFGPGMRVRAVVPWSVRFPTMANHTATHLLHKALQDVLGEHARQAGSAVRPDKLRFDFTHPQALTSEERAEIERQVNERIFRNLPVRAFIVPLDEARRLGAMMLFGEKYGDEVRLVEIAGYSRELCGGTHVRSTAEIGPFVILSEGSVGSGTRRIEAVTSGEAYAMLQARAREAQQLAAELERARKETPRREEPVRLEPSREEEIGGVNVFVGRASGVDLEALLAESDRIKQERAPAAVVLGSSEDGRVHLVANFDNSLEGRLDAVAVIREAAAEVGGGGGGRATMARAGGKKPEKLDDALAKAEEALRRALA
jgi:alanyl-tRNA synthetase